MKRLALAFGLINASLVGCTSTDSRVTFRDEGLSESKQVASDAESSPRPAPLVARLQKMVVRMRESGGRRENTEEVTFQSPELIPVPSSATSHVAAHAESQSPDVHSDENGD